MHIDIESIITALGGFAVIGILAVIFAETGLLVGFFLPGDSLLFVTGLQLAQGSLRFGEYVVPIWLMCILVSVTALAGDQTGYFIGRKLGSAVFNRPNSRFFNHKNVEKAHAFFERYGSRAVILAHFVPVMRTFIPVAAGVGEMTYSKFLRYNIIGVVAWGTGLTLLGSWLGTYQVVKNNVEIFALLFVVVSSIPILVEVLRERARGKREAK